MTTPLRLDRLRLLIEQLAHLTSHTVDEPARLATAANYVAELVQHDDWLPEAYSLPHPQHYQQYLLHVDSVQRFSIVSFVWGPGQATPIHDHRVWGAIGMLRGAEKNERFRLDRHGVPLPFGGEETLHAGQVETVSQWDGDIHRVSNAYTDRTSISIHVYGGNIGAVRRAVYTPDGTVKPFISGYSNSHIPNIWDLSKEN